MPRNAQSFIVTSDENLGNPGAIRFARNDRTEIVGFTHACPCGCGKRSFIRLNPSAWAPESRSPMWERTGPDEAMTLTPSIGIKPQDASGAYHWHGYLRNGVFEEC